MFVSTLSACNTDIFRLSWAFRLSISRGLLNPAVAFYPHPFSAPCWCCTSPLAAMDETLFREDMDLKTKDAPAIQMRLLHELMSHNAGTEYLRRHGAGDGSACGLYKLPIVEYVDIEKDVERIADGDVSPILSTDPICQMFLSSGTTGKPKLIPATKRSLQLLFRRPIGLKGSDLCLSFMFATQESKTKGGIPVSTTTTTFVKGAAPEKMFTSPMEVILATDIDQSIYCHLLCGLIRSREVTTVYAPLARMLVEVFRAFEVMWPELTEDIKTGTLSKKITDRDLRSSVSPLLHSNPELAEAICRECAASNWNGIIGRIWSNAKALVTMTTGAMATYVPSVKKYGGRLPIISGDYVSTECVIGFNLNPLAAPESVTFTMHPDYAYYEFLPCPEESTQPQTVGLADVKIGKEYQLVITTWSGLYRFKVGDVVRVTGFHNLSPNIVFVHRMNAVLNVANEQTTEYELQSAIEKSLQLLPESEEFVDFTSYIDDSSRPQHYVICLELKSGNGLKPLILQYCCYALDSSLNQKYRLARAQGSIGPLKLCIVRGGTFKTLQQHKGTTAAQYKTPRCISNPKSLDILKDGTTQQCHSPSFGILHQPVVQTN